MSNHMNTITDNERSSFWNYFDLADELWATEKKTEGPDGFYLTEDDFDSWFIESAKVAAKRFGLPWPAYLPAAEEYALDHKEVYVLKRP